MGFLPEIIEPPDKRCMHYGKVQIWGPDSGPKYEKGELILFLLL